MNSKKLISMILLLLLVLAMPFQAFAEGAATAEIPFAVKNASGTVVIESVDSAPLPKQTEFEGVSTGKFELSFTRPGEYYYKVYQKSGTEQGVTYDSTVYSVCIAVFSNNDGSLYSVTAVNVEYSSQKAEIAEFENTLAEPSEPSKPIEPTEPTVPSAPTEPTSPNSPSTPPSTGDNSRLGLWVLLMVFSVLGIAVVSVMYRTTADKSKKRNQN